MSRHQKLKFISNGRIEETIENKTFSTTRVVLKPYPSPKIKPISAPKSKKDNLCQNLKSELKKILRTKIVHQHEQTPKQFLSLTAKNSPSGSQKAQNDPDLGQKQKLKLNEAQKIKVFQLYE